MNDFVGFLGEIRIQIIDAFGFNFVKFNGKEIVTFLLFGGSQCGRPK